MRNIIIKKITKHAVPIMSPIKNLDITRTSMDTPLINDKNKFVKIAFINADKIVTYIKNL